MNIQSSNIKLDELSIKTKINERLSRISEKNKLVESKVFFQMK